MLKQDVQAAIETKTRALRQVARVRSRLRLPRQPESTERGLDPETGDVVAFGRLRPGRVLRARVVRTETLKPLVVKEDLADR